jgi:ABC-2 type transport system ATP-binding protein
MDVAARLDGVIRRYGAVTALDEVAFTIGRGETVALLGPNGAGKSTAVGVLLGLQRPDGGHVEVLGGSPAQAVAAGRVGAMLQTGALLEGATVGELIALVRALYPEPMAEADVLELAGLQGLTGRRADKLSGGQTQRVRYALAIAGDPELLFLDEPTASMDVESRLAFWEGLGKLSQRGTTVLFATHYLEEADANADRIVVLLDGRVAADGTAADIKAGAGTRHVRAAIAPEHDDLLRGLPAVVGFSRHGAMVTLETSAAEDTVRAMFAKLDEIHDLEVTGAGLQDAFLALTRGTRNGG